MTRSSSAPRWQEIVGSVRGASHARTIAPNQDAARTTPLDGGKGIILAAADGHGSPLHARSKTGSGFAADTAIEVLAGWVKAVAGRPKDDIVRSAAKLPEQLVTQWRGKVLADLKAHPFRPEELGGRQGAEQVAQDPVLLYGSTFLAAAVAERFALYLQLGDGDVLTVRGENPPQRPVEARADLPVTQTESLCHHDAAQRFRIQIEFFGDVARPDLVLLATDGYANSYADDHAFLMVGQQLKGFLDTKGAGWVRQNLPQWLDETSRKGSGDDITLAGAWSPPTPPLSPSSQAWKLAAAAAAVLVVAGFAAWWLIPSPAPPEASSTAVMLVAPNPVNAVAFAPDGATLAVASDKEVGVWDLRTRKPAAQVRSGATALAFSPDGSALAAAADKGITVADRATGQTVASLPAQAERIRSLAFAPDGATIAFATEDAISIWNLKDAVRGLGDHSSSATALAFAPNGSRIASAHADGTIRLWSVDGGADPVTIETQAGGVGAIALSPDGAVIASGGADGSVKLWKVEAGSPVRALEAHMGRIRALAFAADGTHVQATDGNTVASFATDTGKAVAAAPTHAGEPRAVALSHDGKKFASAGQDKTIRIWDLVNLFTQRPQGGKQEPAKGPRKQ